MRISKKTVLFFLLLICSSVLSAQQTTVFKLPFPQQYKTLDTIIDALALQDPKIALLRLKELEMQARGTNNELALLNYKRSEIRYRYIRTINNEKRPVLNQLIADTERLITAIDEQQYPEIAALLHFQIGNSLDYQKYNYKEQFKHYLKAYDLFKNIPLAQFPYRYYSQYAIALAYYRFEEFEKAIALGKEVEALFPKKDFNSILTVNLIGLSYLELKKYDKAITAFEWILKNNKYALSPKAWQGISLCNLANVYYSAGNNFKAIHYLEQGIPLLKQEAVTGNLITASMLMAKIYISQKNSMEAKSYLDIVANLKQKVNSQNFSYDINKLLSDYYQLEGNDKLSLYHLQLATIYKDSLNVATNLTKKHKAETIFEKEKNKFVLNQIENKMLNQRAIGFVLFLLLLSLVVSVYIYFDRSKLKLKIQQQELQKKNNLINSELTLAHQLLEEYAYNMIVKTQESNNTKNIEDKEYLFNHLINDATLYSREDWSEFKNLFEKAYPGYLQSVKEKLPKVSPAELRFIVVHKLNLKTNEMALVFYISQDAVRKLKKRFTLKIAENLNQTFDDFITSLK
jgi:tetratricopeptide (TPR) repeat protein